MERDWERHDDLDPWPDGVVRAVAARAVEGAGRVTALSGGLANHNWRVDADAGPVVVRAWTRDPTRADVECALLAEVAARVPVPRVLHRGEAAGVPVAVLSWVRGQALAAVWPTLPPAAVCDLYGQAGAALHDLQDQGYDQPGLLGLDGARVAVTRPFVSVADAWRSHLGDLLFSDPVGGLLGDDRVARLWSGVATLGPCLDDERDVVLCHADFKPENLFVEPLDGGWQLTGVLDWEFAWAGSRWFDAGQLLRWEHALPPGVAEAFAQGWQGFAGELPDDWRLRARLLDWMNLAGLLARSAGRPVMQRDLLELVDQSLAAVALPGG